MAEHAHPPRFHGPKCWAASAAVGAGAGLLASWLLPGSYAAGSAAPEIPLWLVSPFALLLAMVAVMPFLAPRFWHHHYPDVSLFLGAAVAAYTLAAFSAPGYRNGHSFGVDAVLHAAVEYYAFISLVGGLFIASGGISVVVHGRGTPARNTALLAAGSLLANLVGTTGASVLLIRPFLRANAGRITPMHVVFFILTVSNCGGSLTPIGDPPLYLGFLKGIPFFWTAAALWADWLLVVGGVLAVFFLYDRRVGPAGAHAPIPGVHPGAVPADVPPGVSISGAVGITGLLLLVAGVFIDPALKGTRAEGLPVGATFQALVAAATFLATSPAARRANGFTVEPIKEVGLLFAGIFATMIPALAYLASHGPALGLRTPTAFYAGTGALSAVLDNAPTYLNFLQIAVGRELDAASVRQLMDDPAGVRVLHAVSTAAVYFGALTYIGNGPNFMVRAIAESSGVRMPSFFGYLGRALAVLGPVLLVHWAVLIR